MLKSAAYFRRRRQQQRRRRHTLLIPPGEKAGWGVPHSQAPRAVSGSVTWTSAGVEQAA